jgi:diguanylate cyclase (GGDEF)-like protein
MRHLVWQTRQVAEGDVSQQIDFFGEFSLAFNSMIDALRQKQSIEELLRHLSTHDSLTTLYNRLYFTEELSRLERGRHFPVSIIIADIDFLKQVNDSLGHEAGDRMIRAAADILRKGVRGEDVVARLGGDEFGILLPSAGVETAARVMERIREIEVLANEETTEFAISISYGIATAEEPGPLADTMRLADQRMYEDKAAKKNNIASRIEPDATTDH